MNDNTKKIAAGAFIFSLLALSGAGTSAVISAYNFIAGDNINISQSGNNITISAVNISVGQDNSKLNKTISDIVIPDEYGEYRIYSGNEKNNLEISNTDISLVSTDSYDYTSYDSQVQASYGNGGKLSAFGSESDIGIYASAYLAWAVDVTSLYNNYYTTETTYYDSSTQNNYISRTITRPNIIDMKVENINYTNSTTDYSSILVTENQSVIRVCDEGDVNGCYPNTLTLNQTAFYMVVPDIYVNGEKGITVDVYYNNPNDNGNLWIMSFQNGLLVLHQAH